MAAGAARNADVEGESDEDGTLRRQMPVGLRPDAAMNSLANSILSRNAARQSAVEPHGVFNCKMKLRRATLTPRNENQR
jgi:hypothetical protein